MSDGDPGFPCDGNPEIWLRCATVLEQLPGLAGIQRGSDVPSRIRGSVADLEKHGVADSCDWVVKYVCDEIAEPIVIDAFGFDDSWTPDERAKIYAVRALLTAFVHGTEPPPPETIALALSASSRLAQAASILGMF